MTRVLVVDDNEENRYYLRALLGSRGCEVQTAKHGAEALELAHRTAPEMVISDLLMPVMDGYTLLRKWKADPALRHVPFVVYTATYTELDDERLAFNLGADAFILKPAEPEDFLQRLAAVQDAVASARAHPPSRPMRDERSLLEEHVERLIQKLEQRGEQLEQSNLQLQQAEREASARAAILDALFASVPDVVMQVDLSGNVQLLNRPLPGLPALGQSWLAYGRADHQALMQRAFDGVIASGEPTSFESLGPDEVEPAAYWSRIAPVRREGKVSGAVVVARDITERKRTEAQLMASDRMASLGTLAASVAHEINNPLASVTANLALLKKDVAQIARQQPIPKHVIEQLLDAEHAAQRVRLIVRDLKLLSRSSEDERSAVDVEQVLDATLRLAWNELRHRARLVKRYAHVPQVYANEARLGQVFLNLLVNAAQAVPEGDLDHNEVTVTTELEPGGRVGICIADTGVGIPEAIQSRIFQPFLTTKPAGIGTGIGLSICKRLLSAFGGTIGFESTPGEGTRFRISLPVAAQTTAVRERSLPAVAAATRRGHVLIVDDEAMLTRVLERLLSEEHTVTTVNSVENALPLFEAGQRFDAIVCDLMMPRMSGMDLHARLLASAPGQAERMIFASGGAFTPAAVSFLDSVRNPRLGKPFELERLRALINGLVSSER